MNPFSKIFVINLDNEVGIQRRIVLADHFMRQNIPYSIFKATEHERGAWGLLWTMKRLFIQCVSENLTNVLVFEDDAYIVLPDSGFWPFIETVWPQLPKDYFCLCLGTNLLSVPVRISDNILRIRSAYATHAIVYSLEAMREILKALDNNPTCLPYDIVLLKDIQQVHGKCYCTYPQLVLQRPGYSSIEKGEKDWGKVSAFTYKSHTFQL
jgi:GR25 family glycosyltransferase involved in LPS biosynthesis